MAYCALPGGRRFECLVQGGSSPAFGHNRFLLKAIHEMRRIWSSLGDQPWENVVTFQAARQRELELMASCRDMISFHALPCTLVGFGNSGFASKLKSLLHSLRLEEFTDDDQISMIQEIVTSTQDYSTEKAVSRS